VDAVDKIENYVVEYIGTFAFYSEVLGPSSNVIFESTYVPVI
jgi:hypothetical protein